MTSASSLDSGSTCSVGCASRELQGRCYRICMVSDCFYPDAGGVENHMITLAQCLILQGHKVIVVTRSRGDRVGVRWMTNGLKVYYTPLLCMPDVFSSGRVVLPTLFASAPLLRSIWIREQIEIVHGHQAFSVLCHEALLHARTMGLKTCFTDHSLFGFSDASSIHMNKVLEFTLCDTGHVICVSHTSKENTVLRANLISEKVSVIPNAVDTTLFTPNAAARKPGVVTVVAITRLVYRKGVDLMVDVIPEICQKHPNVNFVIGGDGPKKINLEEMVERHQLHERVELLGHVQHCVVRNVLCRGHIYLNCSLTEAFCIAILEAASCGLLVVSTKVGGVPEVIPNHMIKYCEPSAADVVGALSAAISHDHKGIDGKRFHDEVTMMYSWHDVAERTTRVYDILGSEARQGDEEASGEKESSSFRLENDVHKRLKDNYKCGSWAGKLFCLVVILDTLLWFLLRLLWPAEAIEVVPDFPCSRRPVIKSSDGNETSPNPAPLPAPAMALPRSRSHDAILMHQPHEEA